MLKSLYGKILNRARLKSSDFDLDALLLALNRVGCETERTDDPDIFLVFLGDEISAIAQIGSNRTSIKLETTLIFDSDLVNLKTLSNISHIGMVHGLASSGIFTVGDGRSKIYVSKEVSVFKICDSIHETVANFKEAILALADYMQLRTKQKQFTNIDLSMFYAIDLTSFNPRVLGEKKEFLYTSWQKYADDLMEDADDYEDIASKITQIKACADFETKNDLCLAEVGDIILDDLYWHRGTWNLNTKEVGFTVN